MSALAAVWQDKTLKLLDGRRRLMPILVPAVALAALVGAEMLGLHERIAWLLVRSRLNA